MCNFVIYFSASVNLCANFSQCANIISFAPPKLSVCYNCQPIMPYLALQSDYSLFTAVDRCSVQNQCPASGYQFVTTSVQFCTNIPCGDAQLQQFVSLIYSNSRVCQASCNNYYFQTSPRQCTTCEAAGNVKMLKNEKLTTALPLLCQNALTGCDFYVYADPYYKCQASACPLNYFVVGSDICVESCLKQLFQLTKIYVNAAKQCVSTCPNQFYIYQVENYCQQTCSLSYYVTTNFECVSACAQDDTIKYLTTQICVSCPQYTVITNSTSAVLQISCSNAACVVSQTLHHQKLCVDVDCVQTTNLNPNWQEVYTDSKRCVSTCVG